MRPAAFIFTAGLLAVALPVFALAGTDEPAPAQPPATCGNGIPGGTSCVVTKEDLKEAREAFVRGMKLSEHNRVEEAFKEFDEASRMVPRNLQFLTAREVVKAELVFQHVQRGNALLLQNSRPQAAAEFRAALDLDPENQFVQERFNDALQAPETPRRAPSVNRTFASEIQLVPKNDLATFHFRGDVRGLFTELGAAYGISAEFDDSVQNKQVRFNVENVDFFTALKLACEVSKTMWTPLSAGQLYVAADNVANHREFDRMSLQTFILPPHSTPQEANDFITTLRNMFDLHFITSGQTAGTVEIRAPAGTLRACAELLAQLSNQRPQVVLDVRVLQISHELTRTIGMHIPDTFTLYNIPAAAIAGLAGLGGQNIQQLINQLISSGGINQAGSSALSGLLAQLGGQSNNIFSTPLTTFGGGMTFMGLSLDQITTTLALNESWVRSLSDMTMRANQGSDATFHVGERYPIMNASYAPIYNSPQISQVLGNQSYVPPFPSVSYEDLGLNMKAKPTVQGDNSVTLQLELEVRSLTGDSNNGVPVISNREYKGAINLKDGEPAVVAGEVSRTDTLSMSGIPGLGALPLLNQALLTNTKNQEDDELMIVITPHVVADINRDTPEIWLSQN
ncbi:MAG TPA: type II and III secretion system protein [Terriglobales bacterium]|nr:type II and III secretion system protein [Terriglobales bacterium]